MNNNELFSALAKAQAQFDVAKKDSDNPFYKSKYASLAAISEASKQSLAENGLCITQPIIFENSVLILRTILGHSSGQYIQSDFPLPHINENSKNPLQDYGKAITYLRRYAIQSLLNIAIEDDDGNSQEAVKPKNNLMATPLVNELMSIFSKLNIENQKKFINGINSVGFKDIYSLPDAEYSNAKNYLNTLLGSQSEVNNV